MIVYFAADLLWSTRIGGTAKQAGIPARPVRTVEMLRARLADSPVKAAIVDLDSPDLAIELIRTLRAHATANPERPIRIVAFGPHVATELFKAARQAGADQVLARGALDRRLPDLLRELSRPEKNGTL